MGLFGINIFNFDNLFKLFEKGDVEKAYQKMGVVAEDMAIADTKMHMAELLAKGTQNSREIAIEGIKYRKERQDYHMDKMIKLLELKARQKSKP